MGKFWQDGGVNPVFLGDVERSFTTISVDGTRVALHGVFTADGLRGIADYLDEHVRRTNARRGSSRKDG
jgi:hypothetical protein